MLRSSSEPPALAFFRRCCPMHPWWKAQAQALQVHGAVEDGGCHGPGAAGCWRQAECNGELWVAGQSAAEQN